MQPISVRFCLSGPGLTPAGGLGPVSRTLSPSRSLSTQSAPHSSGLLRKLHCPLLSRSQSPKLSSLKPLLLLSFPSHNVSAQPSSTTPSQSSSILFAQVSVSSG